MTGAVDPVATGTRISDGVGPLSTRRPRGNAMTISLPSQSRSVHRAREFASATLKSWGVPIEVVEDIVLALSELVTNAVEHGKGQVQVELSIEHGRCLRAQVHDEGASGVPASVRITPTSARSRGLAIVEALSHAWGYRPDATGKWVWAEFSLARVIG